MKPFTVQLNLHGDLDFFVRSGAYGRRIERGLGEKTSVKDVIEGCGVPHPEVDLILVNGQPVDFDYAISTDGTVELYPVKTGPTNFNEKRLQVTNTTCFVVDGHLGKLARDLRLLGFDVAYDPLAEDRQLIDIMERENRALLTRDRRLLMHRVVKTGYYPRSQNADEQTVEVIRRFDLLNSPAPFTRCLRCNAPLRKVSKAEIIERLEPLTKIYYEQFRRCAGCGQIYWSGSHFLKLQKRLEKIRATFAG
ncbi:MAG TPA: Mut7-C RNAse domain-containing protein [Candidatus Udaeobacter sp.]|nr:Mut7-C RNAse domain-containing protein [Candidatus Udaeobacter sp.]